MLDVFRRTTTNLFAWILLALLALVLGISFGVPTDTISFGESPLVHVLGTRIGTQEYRTQFNLLRGHGLLPDDPVRQRIFGAREEVLESLVEREVLADAGEAMGLAATTQDAEDLIVDGQYIMLGDAIVWQYPDRGFNYEAFSNLVRTLQTTEKAFIEAQRRELLARTVRDLVSSSVTVPELELRQRYEDEANKLSIRYVRYAYADFAALVDPSESEIDAWVSDHRDELAKAYEAQGSRFVKLPPQQRVWVITVPKGDRTRIDEAARRIDAGEDFRAVARSVSSDPSARSGGDLGWVTTKAGTGLDPVIDERLAELEVGAVSDVLEGSDALYLVRVTDAREGDVPEDEALRELAAEARKTAQGKLLAEARAREDLAKIEAGGQPDEVFPGMGGVHETGLFSKGEPVPALGKAPALVEAVWAASTDVPFLGEVFHVGEAAVLAGLERKDVATDEGYAKVRKQLYDEARQIKGFQVAAALAKRRCTEAKASGRISANDEKVTSVLMYEIAGEDQPSPQTSYSVCDRVGNRGGLLRYANLLGRG